MDIVLNPICAKLFTTRNEINIVETKNEDCYPVMEQLRPHLSKENFIAQVQRQMNDSNFRLVYLKDTEIKAVSGIRIAEWLGGGKNLEIEDLVAKDGERSKDYGGALFDWIVEYANCKEIKLVSHVKRYGAHRFYLNKRMNIIAHYFSLEL